MLLTLHGLTNPSPDSAGLLWKRLELAAAPPTLDWFLAPAPMLRFQELASDWKMIHEAELRRS
jgi:hypothetical protein